MTSQLNVDTIVDKAGSGGTNVKVKGSDSTFVSEGGSVTQSLTNGVAKFLVNYDAYTPEVDGSLNQTSIADNATGNFTSTFTNNFNSASDKFFFGSVWNTANDGSSVSTNIRNPGICQTGDHPNSTSTLDFDTRAGAHATSNALALDYSGIYVSLFGDLA